MHGLGLEFINVRKDFRSSAGQVTALDNINLIINPGEFVGIVGGNGSGKSTLARLCNGLLQPSRGSVYIDGMDSTCSSSIYEVRRRVGMMFQNPDNQLLCPVIEEEIAFGLENLGLEIKEIRNRIEEALDEAGLSELRYHSPHLLSGGQKQQIALASILAMKPNYLILDEPTSMLDPGSRRSLLNKLRKLNRDNQMTIVLISHNPEDLIHTDRIIVLEQGTVYLQGTPREVFAQADELATIGIHPPAIYQLINQLVEAGISVDDDIKTVPELIDKICPK